MRLDDYIRIARRWLLIIIALSVAGAAVTYVLSKALIRPSYTAKVVMQVQLGLATPNSSIDPTYSTQLAQTEAQLAQQYPIVMSALQQAETTLHSNAHVSEFASVRKSVSCSVSALTSLFSCSVTAHEPEFAREVANSLAKVFMNAEEAWAQSRYGTVLDRITKAERDALKTGNQAQYKSLFQNEVAVRQASAQQASILRVVAPALTPTSPSSPHLALNAAIAFILIFGVLMGGVIIVDRVDDSIRGDEDVGALTGLPVLGVVPTVSSLKGQNPSPASLVVMTEPRSPAAETFRLIWSGIAFSRVDDPPRVILVTSSVQGEGKSTIAANLALAFGEAGRKTVLVDLDLRRPSVSDLFETKDSGLSNLLIADDRSINDRFLHQVAHNVRVLPSGPIPPNPGQMISSRRMMQVISMLRDSADIVVVDAPPVLPVADAVMAASWSDATVVVVNPERAKRRPLLRALANLAAVKGNVVGLVVNSKQVAGEEYYYRYQYGADPQAQAKNGAVSAPRTEPRSHAATSGRKTRTQTRRDKAV